MGHAGGVSRWSGSARFPVSERPVTLFLLFGVVLGAAFVKKNP